MATESDPGTNEDDRRAGAQLVDSRTIGLLVAGLVAGSSVAVLGSSSVALPTIGAVPGPAVGIVGLGCSAIVYRRFGCGGSTDCGCSDECGDRCSYDS